MLTSSYRKSVDYIVESSAVKHLLKRLKNGMKKNFSHGLSKDVYVLVDECYKFKEGDEPIESIQDTNRGVKMIDFIGVVSNLNGHSKHEDPTESMKTKIKRKRYLVEKTELSVSSIFQPIYHVKKSEQLIDVSMDNGTRSYLIASLEAEYCSHAYNHHNIHHNDDTIWYDFVDIDAINVCGYDKPIGSNYEIHNDMKFLMFTMMSPSSMIILLIYTNWKTQIDIECMAFLWLKWTAALNVL